jgi:uncharacterized protein (DUF2147 family)
MAKLLCLTACIIALAAFDPATASGPTGTWLVQNGAAKVRIVSCGDGICGSVIWLSQPLDSETGMPLTDKLNALPDRRNRPVLGVNVVFGVKRKGEDNKWVCRMYNPEDGNSYTGTIEIIDPSQLNVYGCVGGECQTEIWTRTD